MMLVYFSYESVATLFDAKKVMKADANSTAVVVKLVITITILCLLTVVTVSFQDTT